MRKFLMLSVVLWSVPLALAQEAARDKADEYVLSVPGRAQASAATFVGNDLVIRDAIGREWSYVRAPEYDTADRKFRGYYCAAADVWLLWPSTNVGAMQVGHADDKGRVTFRPSTMLVRKLDKALLPGDKVVIPPLREREAAAIPLRERDISLPGAYYVQGSDGEVVQITRNPETKVLEYRQGKSPAAVVDWEPKGGAVVINRGDTTMKGIATQEVLSFDKTQWHRIALLGCYFDANEQPHEIVLNDGRVSVRNVNAEGEMSFEPLAVLSAVEVTSPARGRARLRNGKLTWAGNSEEWIGPIWVQGYWEHGGKRCEIEQDGQQLSFQNENGQLSKGKILNTRTLTASDWQQSGTLNVRQNRITFQNGDVWDRMTDEPFPVAEAKDVRDVKTLPKP